MNSIYTGHSTILPYHTSPLSWASLSTAYERRNNYALETMTAEPVEITESNVNDEFVPYEGDVYELREEYVNELNYDGLPSTDFFLEFSKLLEYNVTYDYLEAFSNAALVMIKIQTQHKEQIDLHNLVGSTYAFFERNCPPEELNVHLEQYIRENTKAKEMDRLFRQAREEKDKQVEEERKEFEEGTGRFLKIHNCILLSAISIYLLKKLLGF